MDYEGLYFSLKTKDADTVQKILNQDSHIEFGGINVLESSLQVGQIVFIVLGGDKPSWDTGLIGIGVFSKAPYDQGYEKRNFKVQVDIHILLHKPIKREDLVPYRDTYGIIGIAPIVKWEPNQALSQVDSDKAIALMRAMLEIDPDIADGLKGLVGAENMKKIEGVTTKMVEVPMKYNEEPDDAVESYLRKEKQKKPFQEPRYVTGFGAGSGYTMNRIIFGAPGTGKSYQLELDRKDILREKKDSPDEKRGDYERVTFHPDYTYSQFVGTYKPVSDGKDIYYKFVPGPFMRVYVKAIKNGIESKNTGKPEPFVLLIEEINRAPVAAVFGDVFQLLDRDDDGSSQYEIEASEDIRRYLADELGGDPDDYEKIKIPDNMFIWATMNSADQGVFPMDTAFKRRWDFTYLGVDENDQDIRGKYVVVGDPAKEQQRIEWNSLRKAINEWLAKEKINEDKQLGPYFISRSIVVPADGGNEIDSGKFNETFKNKVLMYLFEDAARQRRDRLFEGAVKDVGGRHDRINTNRYSEVCAAFDAQGIGIFNSYIQNLVDVKDLTHNGYAQADQSGVSEE